MASGNWEQQIDDALRQFEDAREQLEDIRREARDAGRQAKEEARAAGRLAKEEAREAGRQAREEMKKAMERETRPDGDPEPGPRARWEERDSIWTVPEPGSRRATYTREQIARKAVEIADAEGFSAVSMRRVASELGAGTMTLYHYIRDKDDLVALMENEMMSELILPEEALSDDWRKSIGEIARRSREALRRHRWTSDVPPGTEGGPNGMRHFDQSLRALKGTGLGFIDRMRLNALVDDFVFGFAMRENQIEVELSGNSSKWLEAMWRSMEAQLSTGDYPEIEAWTQEEDPQTALRETFETLSDPDRFEHGLQILLDGIELWVEAASQTGGSSRPKSQRA